VGPLAGFLEELEPRSATLSVLQFPSLSALGGASLPLVPVPSVPRPSRVERPGPNPILTSTMSTSNSQRGLRGRLRRLAVPAVLCGALAFLAGCGSTTSDGDSQGGSAPVVNGAAPASGAPSGGTLVTLTGRNFVAAGTTKVWFAGVPATDVQVIDDNTITAVTPANPENTQARIKVTNSKGTGILTNGFLYLTTANLLSDLNSDGIPDTAIAATGDDTNGASAGAVFVFYGSEDAAADADRTAADADVVVLGANEGDRFGKSVTTGDVNGDGHTDLLVGAPKSDAVATDAGQVAIFLGPLPASAVLNAGDADVILDGEGTVPGAWWGEQGDEFGTSISLGDTNRDGMLDILVGAPGTDRNVGQPDEVEDAGRAYLFLGGAQLASGNAAAADAMIQGSKVDQNLGFDVCVVDMNADGRGDLVASYDLLVSGPHHQGRVAAFTSEGQAQASVDEAEVVLVSDEDGDRFGFSLACGDINQDGAEDLIVGAPYSNTFSSSSGSAYLFLGGSSVQGGVAQDLADATLLGQLSNTHYASKVAAADVNGDGYDDVLVGAPLTTHVATWDGQMFVFFGSDAPADNVAYHSDVILSGEPENGERFGSAIELLDSNLDGVADIMTSATGHGGLTGRVYVFHGEEAILDAEADEDDMTLTGESEGGSFGSSISRGK